MMKSIQKSAITRILDDFRRILLFGIWGCYLEINAETCHGFSDHLKDGSPKKRAIQKGDSIRVDRVE